MANVKTAISIREALFKEVDALARRLRVPRSRLFVLAVEAFLEQHRNKQLLERINQAYANGPDRAEQKQLSKMKSRHRELVKGQW
jgi:metal-responsive CopG/Arc/MetJ family transcriptional regulator